MLRTELNSQKHLPPCEGCDKSDVVLTHAVFDDDERYATVLVRFNPDNIGPVVLVDVILADPATGAPAETCTLAVTGVNGNMLAGIIDDPDGLRGDEDGPHPRRREVHDAIDCVFASDARLQRFLARSGYDS